MANMMRYDPFSIFNRSILGGVPSRDDFWQVFPEEGLLKVDMYEEDGNLVVETDLPGLDPDDVDVTVTSDSLTIRAEKSEEEEQKRRDYTYHERRAGACARTINFPTQVVPDKAEAQFVGGTLKLTVPTVVETAPKSVKVNVQKKEVKE